MSWIQKLYETYERCVNNPLFAADGDALLPLQHTRQNAQVEVVLDAGGRFLRAVVVDKERAPTLIPCTERSVSRGSSKPVPHPLCDKLQYLAADFRDHGGEVTSGFRKENGQPHRDYREQLEAWARAVPHPKLDAIVAYIRAGTLTADLIRIHILPADAGGTLIKKATPEEKKKFSLWAVMPAGQSPEDAFVRWRVEEPGRPDSGTWEDESLLEAWIAWTERQANTAMPCMVTGRERVPVARLHPAKIRHAADKAKLISANDGSGFTFRGRFTDTDGLQACSVGVDVTQKAHSALRWLVGRQGYRKGGQAYVAWTVSGASVPSPLEDSAALVGLEQLLLADEPAGDTVPAETSPRSTEAPGRDAGQSFGLKLRRVMEEYAAQPDLAEDIMVMGVDAATPGRMSIIFYRELAGSVFLTRLEAWHLALAWPQRMTLEPEDGKKGKPRVVWTVCAPSPSRIAEAAYGRGLDDKLRNATTERLLACIVDGRELPRDLVECCVRRAANRPGLEHWEWEQTLGVACALYKGYWAQDSRADEERRYSMALNPQRSTRDYLYGRLLAVAEYLEGMVLWPTGGKRPTTAARLMQRFADRPFSTWRIIELSLVPCMQQLQVRRPDSLYFLKNLLGSICDQFDPDEFVSDARLSGEFLLGYHCQIQNLRTQYAAEAADTELTADSEETPHVHPVPQN